VSNCGLANFVADMCTIINNALPLYLKLLSSFHTQTAHLRSRDAGLAPTDKFAGRATPLKGKGCPPEDMKESEFRSAKHFISGTSFKDK
jgi:hypothetical protein